MGSGGSGAGGASGGGYSGGGLANTGGTGYGGDLGGYGTAGEMSGGAGGAGMAGYGGGGLAGVRGSGWGGGGGAAGLQPGIIGQGPTFGTPSLAPGYSYNQATGTVSKTAQNYGTQGYTQGLFHDPQQNTYQATTKYVKGEPVVSYTKINNALPTQTNAFSALDTVAPYVGATAAFSGYGTNPFTQNHLTGGLGRSPTMSGTGTIGPQAGINTAAARGQVGGMSGSPAGRGLPGGTATGPAGTNGLGNTGGYSGNFSGMGGRFK